MAIGDKKSAVMQSDIVNDFTTGGAKNVLSAEMGKTLAQRPNPNLLDNWYFADPVDQRNGWVVPPGKTYYITGSEVGGITDKYYAATLVVESADYSYWAITVDGATRYVTYADAIRGYTGAGYGIDRWKAPASTTLMIRDGYVHLEFAAIYDSITQRFESGAIREGVYTLSVLTPQGYYAWTFTASKTAPAQSPIGWFGVTNLYSYFNYEQDGTAILCVIDNATGETNSCDIIAAKLELGSAQTLAHQDEDGNWVLNDPPPDKALELAKCQRYYYRLGNDPSNAPYLMVGLTYATNEAGCSVAFNLPSPMRANPAIVTSDLSLFSLASGAVANGVVPTAITRHCVSTTRQVVDVTVSVPTTAQTIYRIWLKNGAYIAFDAEI